MSKTFAAYLRTSTEDNQSPEDSRRWQLSLAEQLVRPVGGHIVAVYHDIDVSRSLPWPRRPEATRLLEDVADAARGWDALVVGEPQRAFSGAQFQLVFPVLCHYGVDLWVPEVGGRVDPDSEAHDLVMNLFGGLSKAERRRIQHRTRASVLALATDGRWLGGRPNYGYRLVDTGLPHPNRSKAAAGAQLRTLEPDPDTAPTVRRMFEMYDAGIGFRSIARVLEGEGIPSPGEVGATRHPRSAGVWGGSAVRAILTNPRYLGRQVAGRQRRRDELVDARDPALGTTSKQRWQDPSDWSWSEAECWPPLVSDELWQRVNARITNLRGSKGVSRRPRSEPGRYLFAGAMRCGYCGKSMFGSTAKNKAYYRCEATRPDYAEPSVAHHPPTSVREERVVAAVDAWLGTLTNADHIDATVAAILAADDHGTPEPGEVTRARRQRESLRAELDHVLAAVRAGMDPALAATETRKIQGDIARADSIVGRWERNTDRPAPLSETDVRAALASAGGLVGLLASADRTERVAVYRAIGIQLRYEKDAPTGHDQVIVRLELSGGGGGI
jgi:site-specific DNA recombinase